MPGVPFNPTVQGVHVDYRLTDAFIAAFQSQSRFAATQIAPVKAVKNQSNLIVGLSKSDLFRNDVQPIGAGQPFPATSFEYTDRRYDCKNYGLRVPLADMIIANEDAPVRTAEQAIPVLVQKHMINMEAVLASNALKPGVWGSQRVGVSGAPTPGTSVRKWSDKVNATIVDDVYAAVEEFTRINGVEPNVATCSFDVFRTILTNPEIKNQVKAVMQSPAFASANTFALSGGVAAQSAKTREGRANAAALAMLFGLDALIVAQASYNVATMGTNAANYQFVIGGGQFLLTYNPGALGMMDQCSLAIFAWTNPLWQSARPQGAGEYYYAIRQYRWEDTHSFYIDLEAHYDIKVLQPEAGFYFYNLV